MEVGHLVFVVPLLPLLVLSSRVRVLRWIVSLVR